MRVLPGLRTPEAGVIVALNDGGPRARATAPGRLAESALLNEIRCNF
jgi:hypothetical protein